MSTMSAATSASPALAEPPQAPADQVVGTPMSVRLRRWRPLLVASALLLVVTLITMWTKPTTSEVPLAINNPAPEGAQALAELLRAEGVTVREVSSVDQAVAASAQGATVALINAGALTYSERSAIRRAGGDVVVIGALYQDLDGLSSLTSSGTSAPAGTDLAPACNDRDALAAESLDGSRGSVKIDQAHEAVGCFPVATDRYAYVTVPMNSGGQLRVIADRSIVSNANLASAGNAALSIRALGHNEELVWFDAAQERGLSIWQTVSTPRWLPVLLAQAAVTTMVLALVRGRRFGRIVPEKLPVLVRATETTEGRGRLYRKAADRERAAQALRAATAMRMGRYLGLHSGADPHQLVEAIARASGQDQEMIYQLLYGPTPTDDRSLADLAVLLDQLESEVHPR